MQVKMKGILASIVCLLAICGWWAPSFGNNSEPIQIGVIVSLTDFAAEMGIEDQRCLEVALELKNEAGGILGHPVELIIIDGRSDQSTFSLAAQRLSAKPILAAMGANDISFSQAAGAVFQDKGIVWIDLGGTTPSIPEVGDYNFMTPMPDNDQGRAVAYYISKMLGYDTVAIFKDVASSYGTELTRYIIENLKVFTGKTDPAPLVLAYQTNDVDYTAQLTRLASQAEVLGIQAIVLPTWPRDAPMIAKQARALGIDLPLIGTDGVDTEALIEVGGDAVEGMIYSTHFHYENPNLPANTKRFIEAYIERFGEPPGAFGAMAYDAFQILTEAIELAIQSTGTQAWQALPLTEKRKAIRDVLLTATFTSASQPIKFNEKRQPQRGVTFCIVREGERHFYDFLPYEEYMESR